MIIQSDFQKFFSTQPTHTFRAPGRVNLIGEHTDYNDGFVLPMAIDREVQIAARMRDDKLIRMGAVDFGNAISEFSLDAPIEHDDMNRWSNYVRGVAWALQSRGMTIPGFDLAIQGNVPLGSGLSSSAALEVCAAVTFVEMSKSKINRVEIAQLCQQAESEFVGVKCGIMDQFISALALDGHVLLIDCRDLSYHSVPLPQGVSVIVCDTGKRRGLVDSEYNRRRSECEQAAAKLGVKALRDVSVDDLNRHEKELPAIVFKRARHVVTENARVLQAIKAAKQNDAQTFGVLMNESHESLKNDYAVSCAELDAMVDIARRQPGCFGARLTGAGFGGCTVSLVADDFASAFVENVAREYRERVKLEPSIYVCHASAGAGELK
jgi:galactokinase